MKKILALTMAVILLLSVSVACDEKTDNDKSSVGNKKTQQKVSSTDKTSDTDKTTLDTNEDNGKTDPTTSGGSTTNNNTVKKSVIKDKNYGGKDFSFYFWYEPTEGIKSKIAAFNSKHNANVKIEVVAGSFAENISKSIASGKPYDMVSNHPQMFPSKNMNKLYEPLNNYITDSDYSSENGISKSATQAFTHKGNVYAAVSTRSVQPYVVYYNKEMFVNAFGLANDPYTLWKSGKWTWDKMKELTYVDAANTSAALARFDINTWFDICGVNAISRKGDSYSSNLKSAEVKTALNSYWDMFNGTKPILHKNVSTFTAAYNTSKSIYIIAPVEHYEAYAAAFKQGAPKYKLSNLGAVPLPTGMYKSGKYPARIERGYSSVKGASDPSVAACFALFEGEYKYTDLEKTLPDEVYNAVYSEFDKGGFVGYNFSFSSDDLTDTMSGSACIRSLGNKISGGSTVDSAINSVHNNLNDLIELTLG